MAKTKVRKGELDNPKRHYWQTRVLTKKDHQPFVALEEVDWDNLEEWHENGSARIQNARIPEVARYQKIVKPLGFLGSARHHTTRGRSKAERVIDRYWFVPPPDVTSYRENAFSGHIPRRRTTIYPPFRPKGRPAKKARSERTCAMCGGEFKAKRPEAVYCSPACRKRASRAKNVVKPT